MRLAEKKIREVVAIQYLRAIAAITVVIFHLSGQLAIPSLAKFAASAMYSGVDLFFIISGFVMAWTLLNGRTTSPGAFLKRRLIRIVPLYWLVTALMLSILLIAPEIMRTAKLSWYHAIGSLMFIPVINPVTGLYEPLAIPGWTLNYEMAFYLVLAGAIGVSRGDVRRTLLIAGATIVTVAAAALVFSVSGIFSFYTNSIILEFAFGMAVAAIVNRAAPVSTVLLICVVIAAGLLLFWPGESDMERAFRRGIPATLVVIASAWLAVPHLRPLRILGDASYSIYLSHIVTVAVVVKLAAALPLPKSSGWQILVLLCGSVACVVVGVAVWYVVERPLTRAVRAWLGGAIARPSVSDAADEQVVGVR